MARHQLCIIIIIINNLAYSKYEEYAREWGWERFLHTDFSVL